MFRSFRGWNKVYQAHLKAWSLNKVVYVGVGVYALDPSCASPTCGRSVFIVLPHLNTTQRGMQWCPNPDHYSDSEPAIRSRTPICWALRQAAELQILTSFVSRGWGSNHQSPRISAANAQPLHYAAAVPVNIKAHAPTSGNATEETSARIFYI